MNQTDIGSIILQELYLAFFGDDQPVDLTEIRKRLNINEPVFQQIIDNLEAQEFIRIRTTGPTPSITAQGVLHAEDKGLVDEELKQQTFTPGQYS